MGKVVVEVKFSNPFDEQKAREGLIRNEAVRNAQVEALVDTGATLIAIPEDIATRLGTPATSRTKVRYADGRIEERPVIELVMLELNGRRMPCSVIVEKEGHRVLIGQIVLEGLDLVVDPGRRTVGPRPESPDMPLLEQL